MRLGAALITLALVAPACSSSDDADSVLVFAAASLAEAFTEIENAFETSHPDIDVVVNFGASSTLATQIANGAPVDVFASADETNMKTVADLIDGDIRTFATNQLRIITRSGNPLGITSLDDLSDPSVLVVTCAPEVPIGAYTRDVLTRSGVEIRPVSFEESVKGIVTKVITGEADAGIVYTTDVIAAGSAATGVEIPADLNVAVTYPVARRTPERSAELFVDFLTSPEGVAVLTTHGFGSP